MSKISLKSTITEESEPSESGSIKSYKSSEETNIGFSNSPSLESMADSNLEDSVRAPVEVSNTEESDAEAQKNVELVTSLETTAGRYLKLRDSFIKNFLSSENDQVELNKYFRITNNKVTILSAQEPWPKDVLLFQPYEVEQILLPDNANCLAVQTFLKMCQLEYKVEARPNAEAMSPTGKVPFIKCGAFIVSELEGIVQFVGSKGISLTSDLDGESKADMRAYMTLVNNVLGNAELYLCWCDNETYNEVTKPRYGSVYPWPLNHIQVWSKRQEEIKRLKVIGWYQKSMEEVYNDVETCCQALTDRLDNNQYFFGSKFTELDALIYGHLHTLLTCPTPTSFAVVVEQFPALLKFCQRISEGFNDYSWPTSIEDSKNLVEKQPRQENELKRVPSVFPASLIFRPSDERIDLMPASSSYHPST